MKKVCDNRVLSHIFQKAIIVIYIIRDFLYLLCLIYYVSFISSFSGANPLIVGEYENLLYNESAKNDWHYVNITYDSSNSVYLWKNRANVRWKLYPTDNEDELRVEKSNPYFNSGWTIASVTNEGIYGPRNELYTRMK